MKELYFFIILTLMFERDKSDTANSLTSLQFHLPTDLKPVHYDVEIFSELEYNDPKFWGKVWITVECRENTNLIVVHQDELEIDENKIKVKELPVVSNSPSTIRVIDHKYVADRQQYVIILERHLEKDKNYEVEIKFSGKCLRKPAEGYVSVVHHTDGYIADNFRIYHNDPFKRVAFTQLDKFGARRIFPCFDEVGMKATFTMRIGRPSALVGYTNADFSFSKTVSSPQDWVLDEFKKTEPMEASALAMVLLIPSFAFAELTHDSSQTNIRVFGDASIFDELGRLSVIVFRIFNFFWSYFHVEYAFGKLDVFVLRKIRHRSASSFGVIYVSEDKILEALKEPSNLAAYEVISELCHLMSKQWIGYTATMTTFYDNYLHTALNLFFQSICVVKIGSQFNPKWEMLLLEPSVLSTYMDIFDEFADNSHNPILLMGTGPDLILHHGNQKLARAYNLFRMIHVILGPVIFQKSIFNYLIEFKSDNSSEFGLWHAFTKTANENSADLLAKYNLSIGGIAASWLHQAGYPLISVIRNYDAKEIYISQMPFNYFEDEELEYTQDKCWLIPLSYKTKSESRSKENTIREWLTCTKPIVLKMDIPRDEWILFDLDVVVMGRIQYDEPNWISIVKSLVDNDDPAVFNALTRARLISDMFALAEVGKLSYKIVLDAMKYLPVEMRHENLTLIMDEFYKISSRLINTSFYESFENYARKLLDPVFNRDEFKNLYVYPAEYEQLKVKVVDLSCKFGVHACQRGTKKIIKKWRRDKKWHKFPGVLNGSIHCQGIKNGNEKYWYYLWDYYLASSTEVEKRRQILKGLGCTTSERLLKELFESSIRNEKISMNDSLSIFRDLLFNNRKGYKVLKQFFTDHYDEVLKFCEIQENTLLYWIEFLYASVQREDLNGIIELAGLKSIDLVSQNSKTYKHFEKAEKIVSWFESSKDDFDEYFKKSIFSWPWN